jgi:anti-sigma factor RsiW
MMHKDIHQQLPDYVLGLLSPGQTDEVTEHLVGCAACRRVVLGEREIGALVRGTLNVTTRPEAARMSQLMPPVPQQSGQGKIGKNWTGRLVPALVVLFVILGSLLISAPESKRPMSLFNIATATATSTNTPTATIAQETGHNGVHTSAVSDRSSIGIPAHAAESPAPVPAAPAPLLSPTPVVANSQMAAN